MTDDYILDADVVVEDDTPEYLVAEAFFTSYGHLHNKGEKVKHIGEPNNYLIPLNDKAKAETAKFLEKIASNKYAPITLDHS